MSIIRNRNENWRVILNIPAVALGLFGTGIKFSKGALKTKRRPAATGFTNNLDKPRQPVPSSPTTAVR